MIPSLNLGSVNRVFIGGSTEWSGNLLTLPVICPAGIGCSDPLQVVLSNFDLENREKEIEISWESKSERNNDFYTLEVSVNGEFWQEIAQLDGAGMSSESTQYHFTDKQPLTGQSYYRLSQTDYNGERKVLQSMSNVFYGADYQVYPTLSDDYLFVKGPDVEHARVSLLNNLGEELLLEGAVEAGKLVFDLSEVPNGNYFLKVENSGISCMKRVVVIHH